jgi:hypothetical protein
MENFNSINYIIELFSLLTRVQNADLGVLNSYFLLFVLTCCLIGALFFSTSLMENVSVRDFAVEPSGSSKGKGKEKESQEELSIILEAQMQYNNLAKQKGRFWVAYNKFPEGVPGHLNPDQCVRLASILKLNPLSYTKYYFGVNDMNPGSIYVKGTNYIYPEATNFMLSIVKFHEWGGSSSKK